MEMPTLRDLFDLSGQVAIVTGGSRGLGLEMAEGLGEAGATVVITARREPDLTAASSHLEARGITVMAYQGSVSDPESAGALVQATLERFGRIDILVNNAGTSWGAPTLQMPLERWHQVIETNLTGTWVVSQRVCQVLAEQGQGGAILNISSVAGLLGGDEEIMPAIGYSASKAGMIGLTRTLATHMAKHGIRVNAICPSFFPSKMARGVIDRNEGAISAGIPMGRIGQPGELKGVAVFLASRASSYITGQVLPVDGGATAW